MEKLDKASEMFKRALSLDSRHYNAWWGLGNLYLRQEEFKNAKYHFQKAVHINRGNAVLRISLSQACVELKEPAIALELLDAAAQMSHGGAAASYHKGCVLVSMDRIPEAIEVLQRAQDLAPREPCVKYQLGKAYAEAGYTQKAFMQYSMALDLCGGRDSKDHQIIVTAQRELQLSIADGGDHARKDLEPPAALEVPGTPEQKANARRGRRMWQMD
jgi:anaphase-promoting complex subunit 3